MESKAYALYVITDRGEYLFGIFNSREDAIQIVEHGEDIFDPFLQCTGEDRKGISTRNDLKTHTNKKDLFVPPFEVAFLSKVLP